MNWNPSLTSCAALTACLVGCGGGNATPGGEFVLGSTTTTLNNATTTTQLTPGQAQGVYEGAASNGRYFNTLVLDNDQYYILYGTLSGEVFSVAGVIAGTGQASNGSFASSDLKDFPAGGMPLSGTMSATYAPGASFNSVVTRGGAAVTFSGVVLANTSYTYNTPARLAEVSGTWAATALTGESVSLEIAANGTYAATSLGCNFSGSFVPRASGKNVFNFTASFGPAPCVLANQTVTGHAVTYLLGNGKRQLLVAASDAARSVATLLAGIR
ncbi:hypothetical protein [Janthinobacterium sp. 17J80-10]|uniref:hypothetical protein n=1 Tax=Janthinobacterium sp. 17J80-10 TaxID=2497863 RepID=UPI001005924A|nr:hypothetical protein [Janthinobacterium sp. 17J80-10]QAU35324.1 hypothetical protein EKL02_14700 [Janthinobacterium sp. 17J80-10]